MCEPIGLAQAGRELVLECGSLTPHSMTEPTLWPPITSLPCPTLRFPSLRFRPLSLPLLLPVIRVGAVLSLEVFVEELRLDRRESGRELQ